jgi:hypothetical protein
VCVCVSGYYNLTTMIIHGAMVVDDVFQQFCLRASASRSDGDEEGKMIWREKDQWKINFSGEKPATPLLDTINYPAHMKNLSSQVSFFFFFLSFFLCVCVYTSFLVHSRLKILSFT